MKHFFSILTAIFAVLAFLVSCGGSEGSDDGAYGDLDGADASGFRGIYGIVMDYATGEPVKNANVQLRPSGETTLTGSDGMYEFRDIDSGDYYITVSKVEYTDLVDDNVITVRDRMVRYDLRIKKIRDEVVKLDILDNNGNPITELDFGGDLISKQFQIYNAGPNKINCNIVCSANWVSGVSESYLQIESGASSAVVVTIDRSKLAAGENRAPLLVTTDNGNKELTLVATKEAEMPEVKTLPVTDSSGRTDSPYRNVFHGEVTALGNPAYTERGFCYSSENETPGEYDMCITVSGTGLGEYEYTNFYLGTDVTRYYVRAYVRWNGTYIYGNVESFVWNDVI